MRLTFSSSFVLLAVGFDGTSMLQQRRVLTDKIEEDLDEDCAKGPNKCKGAPTATTAPAVTTQAIDVTTPAPSPPTESGEFKTCRVWGDPQVTTFDGIISANFHFHGDLFDDSEVDSYKNGDYYLMKASTVEIQGRFWTAGGTHRSMMRELAMSGPALGGSVLVVKPDGIFLDDAEIAAGAGANAASYSGAVKIEPDSSGLLIKSSTDDSFSVWVQQSHSAVNAEIFSLPAAGMSGLCGNADGIGENDKANMIDEASKVPAELSIFLSPPFDFAGCAPSTDYAQSQWAQQLLVPNAMMCAISCKGAHASVKYPDFIVRAAAHTFVTDLECYCGDTAKNKKVLHAHTQENLDDMVVSLGSCNEENCMSIHPELSGTDMCVFKPKQITKSTPCPAAILEKAKQECAQSFPDSIASCIVELCNTDEAQWARVLEEDTTFLDDAAVVEKHGHGR